MKYVSYELSILHEQCMGIVIAITRVDSDGYEFHDVHSNVYYINIYIN